MTNITGQPDGEMRRSAYISDCQKYRYRLERSWDASKKSVLFILLNPSTADHRQDDPTVRRCLGFARKWGYGGLLVGNLFAYRTPSPEELFKAEQPVGRLNDRNLLQLAKRAHKIIIAWGNHGFYQQRARQALKLLDRYELFALGLTRSGQPRHPLYLPNAARPSCFKREETRPAS